LRKIGNVLHVLDKTLVVRGGREVVASKLVGSLVAVGDGIMGRISDVFGPVKKPYMSVRILEGVNRVEALRLCGKAVYLRARKGRKERKEGRQWKK